MQYLVVTHDTLMEEVFRRILIEMGAAVEFRGDAKSGLAALEERRFDVVAIDCDDVYQAASLLRAAHASRPNKSSVLLAITNGETGAADAVDMGAQLIAAKPLPPDRARYELRRASQALASGQRRQRYPVRFPVFLSCGQVLDRRAEAVNVSLGGIGLRLRDPMDEDEIVQVRFWIPECATSIQARGEIAWSDLEGNAGLRFTAMSACSLAAFTQWLQRLATITPALTTTVMLSEGECPSRNTPALLNVPNCAREFLESSFAALRISAGGSDAAKTPQLRLRGPIRWRIAPLRSG